MTDTPQQRLACAWCLKEICKGVEPTSHGICAECVKKQFPDLKPTEPQTGETK